jgi:hypothetical protein
MKDAERQARRRRLRSLRSLCTANREPFDAVGFHPRDAVVDEQRDRVTTVFDAKASLRSLLAPIGRLRVLSQQEGNVQ